MSLGVEYILRARDMLSGAFKSASKQADNMQRNIDNINVSTNRLGNQSQEQIQKLSSRLQYLQERQSKAFDERHIGRYNQMIKRTQDELQRLNNLPPKTFIERFQEANGSAQNLIGKIGQVVALAGLLKGAKSAIDLAAGLEQSKIGFEVLLGNQQKAKQMLDEIRAYSKDAPIYDNAGLIESAKMMLQFGTSAEKILPNLKMFGDIAMGDRQKLDSLALVYTQIANLGKLQTQDWKQMAGAGFNVLKELEKMTGKSMDVLQNEMEKGKISIEMVDAALQHATNEGGQFFGMAERMGQTTAGQLSKLKGNITDIAIAFGEKFLPYINQGIEMLAPLVDWIGNNSDMILKLTGVVLGAVAAFHLVTGAIQAWILITKAWSIVTKAQTVAQGLLNLVMKANPIGIVITAIAALVAAIIYCYNKFDWFRSVINGVWDTMKLFVKFLKDSLMNVVHGLVDTFSGLGKIIKSVFSADWDGVKEGAKQAAVGYANAVTGVARSAYENGSKIGETFAEGYNRGVNNKKDKSTPGVDANSFFNPTKETDETAKGSPNVDPIGSLNGVTGGGSKSTNININLNKEMIGQITINPLTMTQGVDEIKDVVMEALSQILNSTNRLAIE